MEMLRYMYTGMANKLTELAAELLIAADKYELDGLRLLTEKDLIANLKPENAKLYFKMGRTYGANLLVEKVFENFPMYKCICKRTPKK